MSTAITPSLSLACRAAVLLKALPPIYQALALHAARCWTYERLDEIASGKLLDRREPSPAAPSPLRLATVNGECLFDTKSAQSERS